MPSITVDQLHQIPTPAPTKTWNPIPHYEIYDQVEMNLNRIGIDIIDSRIDTDKTGANVFVSHTLDFAFDPSMKERGLFPQLGWRNSISKKLSIGFTAGKRITVCSNLVFSGSWVEFRKHTSKLTENSVDIMCLSGIEHLLESTYASIKLDDMMMQEKRSQHHADHLFMEMLRTGVVTSRQLLDLSNGFDEEKSRYGETLYAIYNAATQQFRTLALPAIADRSKKLNDLMRIDLELDTAIDIETVVETEAPETETV